MPLPEESCLCPQSQETVSPPTWLPFVHTSAHRIRSLLILTYKDAHGRLRSAFKTVVEVSNVIHGVKRKKKLKTVGGRSLKNVITRILWGGEKKKKAFWLRVVQEMG